MLNELLEYRRSILMWGVTIPESLHQRLQKNPVGDKKATRLALRLGEDGAFTVTNFPEATGFWHYYWACKNKGTALTFKFYDGKGTPVGLKFLRLKERHRELAQLVGTEEPFDRLTTLADRFDALKLDDLVDAVGLAVGEDSESRVTYLSLDLEGGPPVQDRAFFLALSARLCEIDGGGDGGGELDMFGNPAGGSDNREGLNPQVPIIGYFPLYSKNDANECYARLGKNSIRSCEIGTVTRKMLSDLVQSVITVENRADPKGEKPGGLWYEYYRAPAEKGGYLDFALTSLYPPDSILEVGAEVDAAEWDKRIGRVIDSLVHQSEADPAATGKVLLFRKLKGPMQFRASATHTLRDLAGYVASWSAGLRNGPTLLRTGKQCHRPSLLDVYRRLNKKWSISFSNVYGLRYEFVTMPNVYQLFFEDPTVLPRFQQHFATNVVPMLLKASTLKFYPFDFYYLLPVGNLILHKGGTVIDTNDLRNNKWPFILGQMFYLANRVHWLFFNTRNIRAPQLLIGQRFVQSAYSNPKLALAGFEQAFQPCANWVERSVHRAKLAEYKELHTVLAKLTGGELPARLDDEGKILLAAGYHYFETKAK